MAAQIIAPGGTAPTADPTRARPRPAFTCCLSHRRVRRSADDSRPYGHFTELASSRELPSVFLV